MRTATTVEFAGNARETADFVVEAEKLGLDICWVAEAWGSDAPSPLGYLAAKTDRILLGSGILQVGTRTPVAVAMAALTLSELSEGRFLLGLGSSGPQIIEGLHGVGFDRPLARMRETVEIVRRPPLRGAQAELLRVVEEQPGIGVAAAARELHLAGNSVSTLVNQLIDAHMLRREVDPLDRRAARLELTEEARQRLDTWRRARAGVVSGALDALSEEDTRAITDALPALEKLMAILKELP